MVSILFEEKVRIPADIVDLESFRRWARSGEFPEHGWFSFLRGDLYVDLSMEQAFTHNRVKTKFASVMEQIIEADQSGYYFSDRMLLSNLEANLSTEPDGMFVSYDAVRKGRVVLVEGADGGYVEVAGAPDMVLEVVSDKSVHKDTKVLRELYWQAGIPEYWLVDARGKALQFEIFRRSARGYLASRKEDGRVRSRIFQRTFHFSRQIDPLGHPQYTLAVWR